MTTLIRNHRTTQEQSSAERLQRAKHVSSARHSQLLEGGDISALAQTLSQAYVEGTTTMDEMRIQVLKQYKQR